MKSTSSHAVIKTDGFTVVELMIVVLIIGVWVAVAMPVFYASVARVSKTTCFAQQRTIDSAVAPWMAENASPANVLAGVVDASHPLVVDGYLKHAPRCAAAPAPVDPKNPDTTTGAYALDVSASVEPCAFGTLGVHGSYR